MARSELLTDGRSRHGPPVFAHDGRRIAYSGNARDPASNDIFMSDIGSEAAPRLVLAGGSEDLDVKDWSLDDTRLAVIRYRSSTDSELLLVDVATGAQTPSNRRRARHRAGRGRSKAARTAGFAWAAARFAPRWARPVLHGRSRRRVHGAALHRLWLRSS